MEGKRCKYSHKVTTFVREMSSTVEKFELAVKFSLTVTVKNIISNKNPFKHL